MSNTKDTKTIDLQASVMVNAITRLQKLHAAMDGGKTTLKPAMAKELAAILESIQAIATGNNQTLYSHTRSLIGGNSGMPLHAELGEYVTLLKRILVEAQGIDTDKVMMIPVGEIQRGANDRQSFAPEPLQELANSIAETKGLISPILIRPLARPVNGHKYELVAGERRLICIRDVLGWQNISAIVRPLDDAAAAMSMLSENIGRVDLNEIEEANAYESRMRKYGLNLEQMAKFASKTTVHVLFRLKLLKLLPELQQMIVGKQLMLGYAQILADAELDETRQRTAIKHLAANGSPSLDWFRQLVGKLKNGQDQGVMELLDAAGILDSQGQPNTQGKKSTATFPLPQTHRPPRAKGTKTEIASAHRDFWLATARSWRKIGKNFKSDQCLAAASSLDYVIEDLA